jgi:hypothetical protein
VFISLYTKILKDKQNNMNFIAINFEIVKRSPEKRLFGGDVEILGRKGGGNFLFPDTPAHMYIRDKIIKNGMINKYFV